MAASLDKLVDCKVSVPDDLVVGKYANSFKVARDGEDYLLDFLRYSPGEHRADLIARVRVKPDLLQPLWSRLGSLLGRLL